MQYQRHKKVILAVLDGFGVASYSHGNAIALANPEGLNFMVSQYPSITLQTSGPLVGLPWGEMGNSEVGHLNLGAGRVVGQDLPRITNSIADGDFFKVPAFLQAVEHVKKHNSKLHLMGLISGGGVHSSDQHLYALLALAKNEGLPQVYIHMFTDGRDTEEKAALESLAKLREKIKVIGIGVIASITGRFYAMDRGKHWQQTEMAYQALTAGVGNRYQSAEECISDYYNQNIYDEMIPPSIITQKDESGISSPVTTISDNDSVIFFNFRQDRALQLTLAFVKPTAMDLPKKHNQLENLFFVTMTEYFVGLPVHIAFPSPNLANNLADVISQAGLKQFHIAESEKYAHVTSFFNGGSTLEFPGEERLIITSPDNSKNYSDHPEMSAVELTDALVKQIKKSDDSFFVANYANPDMVGHTGNLEAAISAVKWIDKCLQRLMEAALSTDAALLITADHGNIEQMINPKTGEIDKDHSTSPVPLIFIAQELRFNRVLKRSYSDLSAHVPDGVISDVAPTILALLGLDKPAEMTGVNLLENLES